VRHIDDGKVTNVDMALLGNGFDAQPRSDQDRRYESHASCVDSTLQRVLVARVRDRSRCRTKFLAAIDEDLVFLVKAHRCLGGCGYFYSGWI
jgi:hypothetical protein